MKRMSEEEKAEYADYAHDIYMDKKMEHLTCGKCKPGNYSTDCPECHGTGIRVGRMRSIKEILGAG